MKEVSETCVTPCHFCKSIEVDESEKISHKVTCHDGRTITTTYSILNQPTCPYKYIKIKGRIYSRVTEANSEDTCHDCGIKFGTIHHVGCDVERCPKCFNQQQLIGCGCLNNDKQFHKKLPRNITPKRVRTDVLRKFIEQ